VRDARRALGRGDADEALVLLWNALEPARLAGDAGALHQIGQLAYQIQAGGSESQSREAERLLELLSAEVESGEVRAATEQVDAQVVVGGDMMHPGEIETEPGGGGGSRLGGLVWLIILVGIILFNLLGDMIGD
jgi:hypothetical protein